MSADALFSLITFLIAGLASPGPNVIMLTTSGARFGARATWPHLLGVVIGVGIIGAVTALGIGAVLLAQPALRFSLQVISALWILWMAYALVRQSAISASPQAKRPMRFIEAVIFQWVNPKIWAVAIAATSAYSAGLTPMEEALRLGSAFSAVNLFVCVFWTYSGQLLARLLNSPTAWRVFRRIMATLLALSAVLIFV
jgi:threonine/homoserine/homoserine lactone efflux protein